MLTLLATAALPAGAHPARYRTGGAWTVAAALASVDPGSGALTLDRAALGARRYSGLLAQASVAGEATGSIFIPAGGRAGAPLRLSDTASALPVVTWIDGPDGVDRDPTIAFQLPGRAGQTWPPEAAVAVWLVEPALAPDAPAPPAAGAYATAQDMLDRYGADEIADLLGLPRGADASAAAAVPRMARALGDTATEFNAALAARYPAPLEGGYPLLRAWTCDVARRRLYDEAPTDEASDAARRARAQLKRLAAGDLVLLSDDGMIVAPRADDAGAERTGRAPQPDDVWAGF